MNYEEMTDDELTSKVAELRGWTRRPVDGEPESTWMLVDPDGNDAGLWGNAPEYATDLNVAIELLLETPKEQILVLRCPLSAVWKKFTLTYPSINLARLICEAWLECMSSL